jgi:hypothetical protein
VLVKLGVSLYRVRRQVIRLVPGYRGTESASPGAGQQERGSAAENQMTRIDAIQSRLSGLKVHLRTGPELREFDEKIAQVRRETKSAIDSQDFEKAPHLQNSEQQLICSASWAPNRRKMRPDHPRTGPQRTSGSLTLAVHSSDHSN